MIMPMAFVGRTEGSTGDRDAALVALYRSEYRALVRLACVLLDDRGTGEEVVQDAFVKLHGAWGRLRDPAAAPTYLRTTVMNLARSRMRRRQVARRHDRADDRVAASAEDAAMASAGDSRMLVALRSLSRRQRECLVLRFYLDLSEEETAATLQIAKGSVKSHTHRGLAALARRLEANDE